MITVQIKHKTSGVTLFEYTCEGNTIKKTIEVAVAKGANLWGANLWGADLRGADLEGANLLGADLEGAKGIMSFGPIGEESRICFLYVNKGIQCVLGCFNGDHNEAIEALQKKYGVGSEYELMLRVAAWSLAKKTV